MSKEINDNSQDVERTIADEIKKNMGDNEVPLFADVEKHRINYTVGTNNNSTNVDNKPIEAVNSQGYNSSMPSNYSNGNNNTNNSSIPPSGRGLENKRKNRDSNGLEDKNNEVNSREQAPDIGKDYGDSSLENPHNGYGEVPNFNEHDSSDDNHQQDVPPNRVPEQQYNNDTSTDKKNNNGLDENNDKDSGADKEKKNESESKNESDKETEKKSEETDANKKNSRPNDVKKSEEEKNSSNQQTGNGYGSLNKPNNRTGSNDSTERARRNFEHNKKQQGGEKKSTPSRTNQSSGGNSGKGLGGRLGSNLVNGVKSLFSRKSEDEYSNSNKPGSKRLSKGFNGGLAKKAMSFLASHPMVAIALVVGILLIFIIFILLLDGEFGIGRGKKICTYELSGISSTGKIEIKNAKVELVNCDATPSDYTVLETIDFEKYVLGVTLAEAGPGHEYDDTYKAQIIAVRNFTLARNTQMCSNPDSCFYGYNAATNTFRMRACTNDQVYWDYTKDIYHLPRSGQPTLYGPEAEEGGTIWKRALSESEIARYEGIAKEVMGEVMLDENGDVLSVGYMAPQTQSFINMPAEGYTYEEILEEVYGYSSMSHAVCSYSGTIDYGDYELSSDGHSILHQRLDTFLENNGSSLEEFNNLLKNNVDDAGYGTRAGVAVAGVTLIAEMGNNYGVKIPYFWGGGHSSNDLIGEALGKWGSTECHTYANDQHYNYCGLDCSGFVAWAIKTGGFHIGPTGSGSFRNLSGAKVVHLRDQVLLQPGDLLEGPGHIVLVVDIDEENHQYICAEASGNSRGVLFTRRSFTESSYVGVDLEDFYNNPANVREKN